MQVTFEALFLLVYANALLVVALGLHRLGRINPSPWRSRVLAGHRRHHPEVGYAGPTAAGARGRRPTGRPVTWPHAEQPRLHTGISMVVASAGLVLAIAGLWRHHQTGERALLAVTATVACAVLVHLGTALRHGIRSTQPDAEPNGAQSRSDPQDGPCG
jgi:hypothetical protein